MILQWTTVKPVIARITRNIKHMDADWVADLPEWIAEAIFKMETHYQLILEHKCIKSEYFLAQLPCNAKAIAAVICNGQRLLPASDVGPIRTSSSDLQTAFFSILTPPEGIVDIEETDVNNWPFYLNTVDQLSILPVDTLNTYRLRYNKIETSIEATELTVWYWTVLHDTEGLPMVPKHEDYMTALYWYCRMMMIGAGFEDKVFSYEACEAQWDKYANRAMNDIAYPSVDEKQRNIINNVNLIPQQYSWASFGIDGAEGVYNDDLT